MNSLLACPQNLQSIFWSKKRGLELFLVMSGIGFLALSAQIFIPLQPIPLTLQSTMVILLGMVYGFRLSMFSIIGYIVLGSSGLPIFAGMASGLQALTGASAGYILGFLLATGITGFLAQCGYGRTILGSFLTACLGTFVIFLSGFLVLAQFVGWEKAFLLGVAPFILTEPLKLLAISFIVPRCWKIK